MRFTSQRASFVPVSPYRGNLEADSPQLFVSFDFIAPCMGKLQVFRRIGPTFRARFYMIKSRTKLLPERGMCRFEPVLRHVLTAERALSRLRLPQGAKQLIFFWLEGLGQHFLPVLFIAHPCEGRDLADNREAHKSVSARSTLCGLLSSMSRSFHARFHFFICRSRMKALSRLGWPSNQTSFSQLYRSEKPLIRCSLCSYARRLRSSVIPT